MRAMQDAHELHVIADYVDDDIDCTRDNHFSGVRHSPGSTRARKTEAVRLDFRSSSKDCHLDIERCTVHRHEVSTLSVGLCVIAWRGRSRRPNADPNLLPVVSRPSRQFQLTLKPALSSAKTSWKLGHVFPKSRKSGDVLTTVSRLPAIVFLSRVRPVYMSARLPASVEVPA